MVQPAMQMAPIEGDAEFVSKMFVQQINMQTDYFEGSNTEGVNHGGQEDSGSMITLSETNPSDRQVPMSASEIIEEGKQIE